MLPLSSGSECLRSYSSYWQFVNHCSLSSNPCWGSWSDFEESLRLYSIGNFSGRVFTEICGRLRRDSHRPEPIIIVNRKIALSRTERISPKHWYLSTKLQGVITQNTTVYIIAVVNISQLIIYPCFLFTRTRKFSHSTWKHTSWQSVHLINTQIGAVFLTWCWGRWHLSSRVMYAARVLVSVQLEIILTGPSCGQIVLDVMTAGRTHIHCHKVCECDCKVNPLSVFHDGLTVN